MVDEMLLGPLDDIASFRREIWQSIVIKIWQASEVTEQYFALTRVPHCGQEFQCSGSLSTMRSTCPRSATLRDATV